MNGLEKLLTKMIKNGTENKHEEDGEMKGSKYYRR
jgi:hypothetical protein